MPVFFYLDPAIPEQANLIEVINEDAKISFFLKINDEYIWPAFMLSEYDEEISNLLLNHSDLQDDMADYSFKAKQAIPKEEAVLINLFGTNLYFRTECSNLLPFEQVVTNSLISRFKKENYLMRFLRMSFYNFKVMSEKDEQVNTKNFKKSIYHLVYIEETDSCQKAFGIVLNMYSKCQA
jgi:hypothetical protein